MKISELTIGQGSVDVEGTIKEVGELRVFSKFGRELKVADSSLEDDSGAVKLTLWNEHFDKFKAGDKVKITNGYVREFQGEKQLTAGKFGKIEKVGESEASEEESEEEGIIEKAKEKVEGVMEDIKEKVEDVVKKVKGEETEEEPEAEEEPEKETEEEPEAEDKEEQEETEE